MHVAGTHLTDAPESNNPMARRNCTRLPILTTYFLYGALEIIRLLYWLCSCTSCCITSRLVPLAMQRDSTKVRCRPKTRLAYFLERTNCFEDLDRWHGALSIAEYGNASKIATQLHWPPSRSDFMPSRNWSRFDMPPTRSIFYKGHRGFSTSSVPKYFLKFD